MASQLHHIMYVWYRRVDLQENQIVSAFIWNYMYMYDYGLMVGLSGLVSLVRLGHFILVVWLV